MRNSLLNRNQNGIFRNAAGTKYAANAMLATYRMKIQPGTASAQNACRHRFHPRKLRVHLPRLRLNPSRRTSRPWSRPRVWLSYEAVEDVNMRQKESAKQ